MKTSDFYYDLPQELIAQDPLEDRSSSRLMHLSLKDGSIEHRHFTDVLDYMEEGDCLVINDTKVIPARLYGHKEETGALIEILLLKRRENDIWECLVKPGKKARPGAKITFGNGILKGEIIDVVDEGNRLIQFHYEGIFEEILDQLGEMPLPPYITHKLKDKNRYQTVYAKNEGSAAAPTAGLHFTKELLEKVKEKGVNIAHVTLHVGLGTFRPVTKRRFFAGDLHQKLQDPVYRLCPPDQTLPKCLQFPQSFSQQCSSADFQKSDRPWRTSGNPLSENNKRKTPVLFRKTCTGAAFRQLYAALFFKYACRLSFR